MNAIACAQERAAPAAVPLAACRICGNARLVPVLDLGEQALTGVFPRTRGAAITRGPLRLVKCHGSADCCGLVQLAHTYDLDAMYGDSYGYRSGLNAAMVRHLADKVAWLRTRRPLQAGDLVLDIGSNDATLLAQYPADLTLLGIDPTTPKFQRYHPRHVTAVPDFFSAAAFRRAAGKRQARIVTSVAMFYDLPAPMQFVHDVASVLSDDGVWHFEQSYLPAMLAANAYDTVCHEHLEYYALRQVQWMTSRAGLGITDVHCNGVNGGSFAVTVQKGCADAPVVAEILAREAHLESLSTWERFAAKVAQHRQDLRRVLGELKAAGKKVYGLGASTKGNVVLQYAGITPDLLPAIAEVNPDKFGCFTPGTELPICAEAELARARPDVLLVLPWHFRQGFLASRAEFLAGGGRLLFPLPEIELVGA
jgi:NDP-4-keto-2,6-dideoxyhexose 3-C-methyltransferase